MEGQKNLSLLYLGKRGGGAQLTLQLAEELSKSHIFNLQAVGLRRDNYLLREYDQSKCSIIFESKSVISTIIRLVGFKRNPSRLLQLMKQQTGEVCLVPMISPLGFLIEKILVKNGIKVIRMIHDVERHKGDV